MNGYGQLNLNPSQRRVREENDSPRKGDIMIEEFYKQTCIYKDCGITWFHSVGFNNQRREDHRSFYCPNGHPQCYLAKTPHEISEEILKKENERLKETTTWLRSERDRYEKCAKHKKHQIDGLRGYIKKIKKEVP